MGFTSFFLVNRTSLLRPAERGLHAGTRMPLMLVDAGELLCKHSKWIPRLLLLLSLLVGSTLGHVHTFTARVADFPLLHQATSRAVVVWRDTRTNTVFVLTSEHMRLAYAVAWAAPWLHSDLILCSWVRNSRTRCAAPQATLSHGRAERDRAGTDCRARLAASIHWITPATQDQRDREDVRHGRLRYVAAAACGPHWLGNPAAPAAPQERCPACLRPVRPAGLVSSLRGLHAA